MVLKINKTMKATNIFQSLKAQGVHGTDGIAPKLPGLKSPLSMKNSPLNKALVGKQKNLPDHLKAAIEAAPESPAKLAPVVAAVGKKLLVGAAKKMIAKKVAEKASPAMMYDKASPAKKYKSDAQRKAVHASKAEKKSAAKMKDNGKKEIAADKTYDPKTQTVTRVTKEKFPKKIKTKVSPAKKKSCGSPVKMEMEMAGPGKGAVRKAKRKAKAGMRRNKTRSCLSKSILK